MWENHLYGSEGGARNDRPYPYLRPSNKYREATSVWAQTGGWFNIRTDLRGC